MVKRKKKVRRRAYPAPLPDQVGLSVDETCAITGLGRGTVSTALLSGALPGRKLGKRWIVKRADALAFLENLPVYKAAEQAAP
jgi:excisionase family DNA binding protein